MINPSYISRLRWEAKQSEIAKQKVQLETAIAQCENQEQRERIMQLYLDGKPFTVTPEEIRNYLRNEEHEN